MDAIEQAQRKVLPKDRQREGLTHLGFGKFKNWIEPMWHEIGEKRGKQADAREKAEQLFLTKPSEAQPEQEPAVPEPAAEIENAEMAANNQQEIQTVVGTALAAAMQKNGVEKLEAKPNPPGKAGGVRRQVHWNEAEKRQVIERADYLMQQFAGMSASEATRKANLELPEERQRKPENLAWSMISAWAEPMMRLVKSERLAREHKAKEEAEAARREAIEAEARAKAEAETQEARDRAERGAVEAAQREIESRIDEEVAARVAAIEQRMRTEQVARPMESIIQMFTDRFAEVAVKAFAGSINRAIQDQMLAMRIDAAVPTPRAAVQVEKVIAPPRERLPKVLVVGLINQQEQDVKQAFADRIEFVFVKSQTQGGSGAHGGAGMLAKANSCDIVVTMADFIGHDVDRNLKGLSIPYYRVNGSVSGLKRWLTGWLTGEYSGNGG
jgi:hypothetical protein